MRTGPSMYKVVKLIKALQDGPPRSILQLMGPTGFSEQSIRGWLQLFLNQQMIEKVGLVDNESGYGRKSYSWKWKEKSDGIDYRDVPGRVFAASERIGASSSSSGIVAET